MEWYGKLHDSKPMSVEKYEKHFSGLAVEICSFRYISLCEFATVSSNEFRGKYGNLPSEEAKQIAMRQFIDSSVERIQRIITRNEALDSSEKEGPPAAAATGSSSSEEATPPPVRTQRAGKNGGGELGSDFSHKIVRKIL